MCIIRITITKIFIIKISFLSFSAIIAEKFVIISPMLNFKGLYIPIKIASYTDTKFLVILSKSDKILFNFYSSTKPLIITYPKGGPGNQLLKVNPQSTNDIVNFIIN